MLIKLTLDDVVRSLAELDPDLMICAPRARPLSPMTNVALIDEDAGEAIPAELSYLLELSLATEILDVWSEWRGGREPTIREAVAAIEWYGDHDAYPPVDA